MNDDDVTTMTDADVIRGALELLPNEDAWQSPGYGRGGKRCIAHAMFAAVAEGHQWEARRAMRHVAAECELPYDRTLIAAIVGHWNDRPTRTFEDVHLVLKRALGRAEETEREDAPGRQEPGASS